MGGTQNKQVCLLVCASTPDPVWGVVGRCGGVGGFALSACYWVLEAQPATILLGVSDPVWGWWWTEVFWPAAAERVVRGGGIDRTLRTTQWTRASSRRHISWMLALFVGVGVCGCGVG